MSHENVFPYSERDIAYTEEVVAALMSPESLYTPVAPELIESRIAFGQFLHDGPELPDGSHPSLKEVHNISLTRSCADFYLDYFRTDEGKEALLKFGIETEEPLNAIRAFSAKVAEGEAVDVDAARDLATDSLNWYKQKLENALTEGIDANEWQDSPTFQVSFDPSKLLGKFEKFQNFRNFNRAVARQIKEGNGEDKDAQLALLEIQMGRVNGLTAALYPDILSLAKQLTLSPDTPQKRVWQARVFEAAPVLRALKLEEYEETNERADTFFRRLDFVRNGASNVGQETFSAISKADIALAEELDTSVSQEVREVVERLPDNVIEGLRADKIDANKMVRLATTLLAGWGNLSAHTSTLEEFEGRTGPAEDNQWQIIITHRVKSLSINNVKKGVMIPRDNIWDGITGLAKLAHEASHTLQTDEDNKTAERLPLAATKGRRSQTVREMGGVLYERIFRAMCGETRDTNTTYLRALQAKESGRNQLAVAQAFLAASKDNDAATASDRILRLYRQGGYDSQALDYLEQEITLRELLRTDPTKAGTIALCVASFSLKDAGTLRQLGLLNIPDSQPYNPPQDVLRVYQQLTT